ncbi:aminodeoxychorismate synthase component I [Chitinispirillales bacterium ANBcel5]|uniref:aminodeoxychorismate synthase component I n=1 Tax=Cellulosispirillum alkaliphilum TaxID=3039283 RepID=UPI002A5580E2|nr:aminodeoxychorismate synthase component I [Chitinispirillales bacterium ANBcel5]
MSINTIKRNNQPVAIPETDLAVIGRMQEQLDCVILLETATPSAENPHSYLFTSPKQVVSTSEFSKVESCLRDIALLSQKNWLAGYIGYETAAALENKIFQKNISGKLLWFAAFSPPWIFDHFKSKWNRPLPKFSIDRKNVGVPKPALDLSIDYNSYNSKIKKIKNYIANGDTYQVNFTFDVSFDSQSSKPFELYRALRENQKAPYCAFVKTPTFQALSFSPELFFNITDSVITVKPMKGTAPRGRFFREDNEAIAKLAQSEKDRSENVMIVDLLRNDLGKICDISSVKTEKLFEIETHRTVHQMTSTIKGKLRENIDFYDIIKALFPCGSVTGAPKVRTMQIISELEDGFRGIYCGALGFVSPEGQSVFNVPIRTLQKEKNDAKWRYRVGSGIVADSRSDLEWEECKVKCRFLQQEARPFYLFESIYYRYGQPLYENDHIKRLQSSARFFQFLLREDLLRATLFEIANAISSVPRCKVKLMLLSDGTLRWEYSGIEVHNRTSKYKCIVSTKAVNSNNIYLFHKTSHRPWYSESMQMIKDGEVWDVIQFNESGEVTEGARSNVFIKKAGKLRTPPQHCGLLNGVLRSKLIAKGICTQEIIKLEDLYENELFLGNSVRGLVRVEIE